MKALRLTIDASAGQDTLAQVLRPFQLPQGCPVVIQYQNASASTELLLGDNWRVNPDDALQQQLVQWLKADNISLDYS